MSYSTCGLVNIPFIFSDELIKMDVEICISSGLGGVFPLSYHGKNSEKHLFKSLNKDYPYEYLLTEDEVFSKIFWRGWLPLSLLSKINRGDYSEVPIIMKDALLRLSEIDLEKALVNQYSFKHESDFGAISNKFGITIPLNFLKPLPVF